MQLSLRSPMAARVTRTVALSAALVLAGCCCRSNRCCLPQGAHLAGAAAPAYQREKEPLPDTPFVKARLKNTSAKKILKSQVKGIRNQDGSGTADFAPPPAGGSTDPWHQLGPIAATTGWAAWTDTTKSCQQTRLVQFEFQVEKADGANNKEYVIDVTSGVACSQDAQGNDGPFCKLVSVDVEFKSIVDAGGGVYKAKVDLTYWYYNKDNAILCGTGSIDCTKTGPNELLLTPK